MMHTDSLTELRDDVECDTIDIFRDYPELVEKHAQLQYVALRLPLVEKSFILSIGPRVKVFSTWVSLMLLSFPSRPSHLKQKKSSNRPKISS